MPFNPIKSQKNILLRFIRYFYDENFQYVDKLIEKWIKSFIPFVITIALTGFVGWLFFISLTSLTPLSWPRLGPGVWNVLNIFQIGLILWCSEKTYRFIRGGYKK